MIRALDQIAEFPLGHTGFRSADEGIKPQIAEGRTDAHPLDLLVGFAHAQPWVFRIQIHKVESRRQLV